MLGRKIADNGADFLIADKSPTGLLPASDNPEDKKACPLFPKVFSAPFISKIVLESTPEDTEKAILEGILALISPVMTFTEDAE